MTIGDGDIWRPEGRHVEQKRPEATGDVFVRWRRPARAREAGDGAEQVGAEKLRCFTKRLMADMADRQIFETPDACFFCGVVKLGVQVPVQPVAFVFFRYNYQRQLIREARNRLDEGGGRGFCCMVQWWVGRWIFFSAVRFGLFKQN